MPYAAATALGLIVAVIDQLYKYTIPDFVYNGGLGLGLRLSVQVIVVVQIALFILIGMYIYLRRKSSLSPYFWFIQIVSLSNLYDRFMRPGVVDYIHVGNWWFNFADLGINLAILIVIFLCIKNAYHKRLHSKLFHRRQ